MSDTATNRILVLGEALVDLYEEIPHLGGGPANVAVTLARRGAPVALATGVGDDRWGRWLDDQLVREGVDTTWFARQPGLATPVARVTIGSDGEPQFAFDGDTLAPGLPALEDTITDATSGVTALFFGSNTLVHEREREVTLDARACALAQGAAVVFDPNFRLGRWPTISAAIEWGRSCAADAFLVKANLAEAQLLTGEDHPSRAAHASRALGARCAVVTMGAAGALLVADDIELTVPAVEVSVVDTTGAGDALVGVLLAALWTGGCRPEVVADALPSAVATAARVTEHRGAIASQDPEREEQTA